MDCLICCAVIYYGTNKVDYITMQLVGIFVLEHKTGKLCIYSKIIGIIRTGSSNCSKAKHKSGAWS